MICENISLRFAIKCYFVPVAASDTNQQQYHHIMTTTTTKNTIATLKNLITMIEIDHVSASDFAEYDCLGLIPDTKEAKIIHLQNLIIAELESAID